MTPKPQDPNEPILRAEYERRHAALRDRYERYARRSTRILAVLVFISLVTGGLSAYLLKQNSDQTGEINGSLVDNCKKNGNPLRIAVRRFGTVLIEQVENDIAQSKAFERSGTLAEIFANLSPAKLHALVAASREQQHGKIAQLEEGREAIQPIDCEKRFP